MNIDIHKFTDLFKMKGQDFENEIINFLGRGKMAPPMLQS